MGTVCAATGNILTAYENVLDKIETTPHRLLVHEYNHTLNYLLIRNKMCNNRVNSKLITMVKIYIGNPSQHTTDKDVEYRSRLIDVQLLLMNDIKSCG